MELVTTTAGYEMLLRWGHLLAGITWIGLLYYFNLVQGEFLKKPKLLQNQTLFKNWCLEHYVGFAGEQ